MNSLSLASDLSDWYHVYEVSKALINPNTYATMTISNGVGMWIFTKGGYLLLSLAWAYPGVAAVTLAPVLIKSSSRQVIGLTLGQTFKLTTRSLRSIKQWITPMAKRP